MLYWFRNLSLSSKVMAFQAGVLFCILALASSAGFALRSQNATLKDLYETHIASMAKLLEIQKTLGNLPEATSRVILWNIAGFDAANTQRANDTVKAGMNRSKQELLSYQNTLDSTSVEGKIIHQLVDSLNMFSDAVDLALVMAGADPQLASLSLSGAEKKFEPISRALDSLIIIKKQQSAEKYHTSQQRARTDLFVFVVLCCVAVAFVILLLIAILKLVIQPVNNIGTVLFEMTQGEWDLTRRIKVGSEDEMGKLADIVNSFIQRLQKIVQDLDQRTSALSGSADRFTQAATRMSESSQLMSQQSCSASETTQSITSSVQEISSAANSMSLAVDVVSESISEINHSITDVARNCQNELAVSKSADTQVRDSKQIVDRLADAANNIGRVVDLIQDIAEQTNLLALNATIEAATAGEAGKGFAVVAGEVKDLARRTAEATEEIQSQINEMQRSVKAATGSMDQVAGVVGNITEISQNIAAAVEQQNISLGTIAKNIEAASQSAAQIATKVSQSAKDLDNVSSNVRSVTTSITATASTIDDVYKEGTSLTRMSEDLRQVVDQFHW